MKPERLSDMFERVWLINLPSRKDRRHHAVQEMERVGLALRAGQVEVFDAIRPEEAAGFPSIGARGCFLSHLAVLQQARDAGCANVLVLEDDISFSPEWLRVEAKVMQAARTQPWDWLYLGHREPVSPKDGWLQPYDKGVVTAHCYAVSARVLGRAIEYLEQVIQRPAGHPDGGPMHVDGAFSMFRQRNPDVATLVTCPPLVDQASFRSDIASGRWFDRTPVVRSAVGVLRWGRRRFSIGMERVGHE